jgi:hypothetical protein
MSTYDQECWHPVPGYEDLYDVSNQGRVRRNGRVLRTLRASTGHLYVTLSKHSNKRQVAVHRIVLCAFVGPAPSGTEARHYPDRDPANNRLENLSWTTRTVNVRDRIEHETDNSGERHGMAVLNWEKVLSIRSGKYKSQRDAADALGVCRSTIYNVISYRTWRE